MSAQLRKNLIRLAHAKPELRSHLLPILSGGQKASGTKTAGRMDKLDWKEIVRLLGGSAYAKLPNGSIRFYKHGWGSGVITISDNGGEVSLSQTVPLIPRSVEYDDNTKPGGMVGENTMAYRLNMAVLKHPIDYSLDLDTP